MLGLAHTAQQSNTGNGGGADFQWGSSQTEQSWKQWRTVEDVGVVVGLVNGDCRGDNSNDAYRKADESKIEKVICLNP